MNSTNQQRTVIEGDTYTVRRSIQISADIDKVWAAVTEPQHIANWFTESATLSGKTVGSSGFFTWDEKTSMPVRIEEIDEPHMIAYRWTNDDAAGARDGRRADVIDDDHSLLMRFTLVEVDGGTLLTVVETGFETTIDPAANMEAHRVGWNQFIDQLATYAEGLL